MSKTIIMSVGGSLIAPAGVDINFLKNFRKLILNFVAKGNKVVIICGGGDTARIYQRAAKKVNPKVLARDLDWVGIGATKINAELMSAIFGDKAHESIVHNPKVVVKTNKKIIVGAGYEPGFSSDMDAVLSAIAYGSDTVINLSNIEYVYDKDPRKYKNAVKKAQMSWNEFRKIVGNKWIPGANVPFDPIASKIAQKNGLKVIVAKGSDLLNLKNILSSKRFKGTIIK